MIAHVLKDESQVLTLRSSTNFVPDINRLYLKRKGRLGGSQASFSDLPDPRIFKLHSPYDDRLCKVIYLMRDPRDVLVSYWHYHRFTREDYSLSLQDFILADSYWPCPWRTHVAGWLLDNDHPNLLLVRYEEMHQDAAAILKKALAFAGVPSSQEEIAAAVEASRFDRMRKLEKRFGSAEKNVDPGGEEQFVRKGRVAGWKDELDPVSLRILEQRPGPVLTCVGYTPSVYASSRS
jgi:hypothetical protein